MDSNVDSYVGINVDSNVDDNDVIYSSIVLLVTLPVATYMSYCSTFCDLIYRTDLDRP